MPGNNHEYNKILINANILTLDPTHPHCQALAIKNGRILATGSDSDVLAIAAQSIPHATVLNLKGNTVLPGFIDAHTHLLSGGFSLQSLDLRGCRNPEEFVRRIDERLHAAQPGQWVTGGGWDQETWPGSPLPCKEWIDPFSSEIPVFVNRIDLHIGLANTAALKAAGITADSPDPCGGQIFRNPATNQPTGILKDAAIRLIESAMPKPTRTDQEKALSLALMQAASHGITSLHDITDWGNPEWTEWSLFQDFRQQNKLTCRIFARLPLIDWDRCRTAFPAFQVGPQANEWLRFGGLKGFTDGSLGGHTAFFFDPYLGEAGQFGLLLDEMFPEGTMERRISEADQAGFPISVHAIGDRANSILLDIFESVVHVNGIRDRRLRIEHAQHLRPEDICRMARLGVTASIQPAHIIDDGGWAERILGADRCRWSYAFQSLANAGVRLAGGSDWPVSALDPLLGIHAAVNRNTANEQFPNGWSPEQKLSLAQAIEAFTVGAAYAEFAEAEKGTLSAGKFADLVVLSANPFKVNPAEIKDIAILMTIAGGQVVYGAI